ncbi:MAG TPA: hypothetical protein VGJ85_02920, partial [Candidatus Nanopelagicaceae bacterium]
GIAVEIPFMFIPSFYESVGAKWLKDVDISWALGLVIAGALYYFMTRSLDLNSEKAAIDASELALKNKEALR